MASQGGTMSSSPAPDSPVRRQSISTSDVDELRAAGHSPILARSFDPNDPQARERQRTMDVDMAMQLSLARRDPSYSPVVPFSAPGVSSPYDTAQGTVSSDYMFPTHANNVDILDDHDALRDAGRRFEPQEAECHIHEPSLANSHLHQGDPSMLSDGQIHEEPSTLNFGLPSYQANVFQSHFDFALMEEFSTAEKNKLGLISTLSPKFVLGPTRSRPKSKPLESSAQSGPSSSVVPADGGAQPEPPTDRAEAAVADSPRAFRHRKLSQSNPHPRPQRKGIGGKMALFEGATQDSPFAISARLGVTFAGHGAGIPTGSYEHIAGAPSTGGILNTGHDRPYRFSFYSNALSATIHARSLSELPAEGQTFEQLFAGIQPPTPDSDDNRATSPPPPPPPAFLPNNRASSSTADQTNNLVNGANQNSSNKKTGTNVMNEDVNTWWLDVLSPTDEEMKMLSKVFSIHPLTTEDILMEETREKIELFRNYYLVCFRSFDQDPYSPMHLEPLNMYIIVFREGILSFHFRPTPHPQNVRRRIKQLRDYISVTSDWISYALIDDITDAFGPLIQGIEYEVDSIDELVLILKDAEQSDMLRRIGTCRKKVMGLLRLMGNKADVVKGLAKRCNENWRVAPTSDIGLYLSDIQDHLITMTQNLNHYEKILSRSHSNYLAQISIEMTDANNQINDVLSKLTALGTVLIPMNLITGLWGMNVHVPGQDVDGYTWFGSIIACLVVFAVAGGYSTYRFMVRK